MTALGDGLPTGYTQVPYIQANGNCQIQTGIVPNSTDKVELSWRPTVVSGNQGLWCSRDSSAKNTFTAFMIANQVRLDRNASSVTCTGALLAGTNYTVVADYATLAGVVTNDISHTELTSGTMPSGTYTPTSELCLFASHQGAPTTSFANAGSWACYSFKLSDSAGNLRLNLVPAKRDADDVLGLYDLVRSTFLTNCNSGVFTTTGSMTITPSDPLWGRALTIAENVTIDAGDGATWPGAITVGAGGSLTTRGSINVTGATVVDPGGSLTLESGVQYFTFSAAGAIKGSLTIAASATMKMSRDEAISGNWATIHLYGAINCNGYRQRLDHTTFHLYDGSRIFGAGNGTYGALDFGYTSATTYPDATDYGRMVIHGTVTIDSVSRVRTGGTLHVACCENSSVSFNGGFNASSGNGSIVQVAATAEEGNASGTCANAFIEFSPINPAVTLSLASNARIALGNAAATYTVSSSAASLEFVADKATAFANHATAQTLPAITADATSASLPTVRLTGDGTVALPSTAPAYPIEFAGAPLVIATNAPVALVAGSSVTVPTTVGVEDLAAGTAATIFTGADSSFDVSKISVKPAHNGVPFGDAAVASLSGTDVVTAGVPAYVSYGWVEPYIVAKALIWLDASDVANFEFKDNTFGYVTTWKDRSAYKRDATAYTVPSHDSNWGTLSVTNGVPAYCMGACNSGIDLQYTRMTTIRTVFWAMSICQDSRAFFLGDSSTYRFHRGGNGEYCYNNSNALWKNGKIYCDGVLVTDNLNTLVPTDRHVYSTVTAANCESNRLTLDRNSGSSIRHAGRELSELIAFDTALSDSDREAIEAYLAAKWMGTNPTAAGTEGTYAVTGDLAVDDHVGGDKNLSFSEGASVTVVNPSSTDAMVATTGAVTIPAGSPLAVNVDAQSLTPGTYTVMQAASGITSLSQFNPTAVVGDGAAATFAVVDGKLTMTIAVSSSVASQTWRPASSADLGWNSTSANWLYDGGATGGFIGYVPAFIDGGEAVSGDITVSGAMTAGAITFTGAKDYTLKGDGVIAGGDTVTFGGTGTVTLDGVSFGGQDIVVKDGQKVVLGFGASQKSLGEDSGSAGGKVTVKDGGQLNINDTETVSTTTSPRHEITHSKIFSIAGEGPDGRGALVNDALDGRGDLNPYGSQFRRIELEGDATVGGTHRMEVRAHTATSATATPGIYGPDKRLTVKSTNPYGFGVVSQPIMVGAVTIAEGATLRPEAISESQFDIPGGITLDGGILHAYSSTYPATIPFFVTAKGGNVNAASGTANIKGPLNVSEGATLKLNGGNTVNYSGGASGEGVINTTEGTHNFSGSFDGPSFLVQGGNTYLASGFDAQSDIDVTHSAGGFFLKEGTKAKKINVTHTGGSFGFMTGSGTGPQFDEINITSTGGAIDIRPQAAGMIDVQGDFVVNQSAGNVYAYGPNTNSDYGVALKMSGSVANVSVGLNSSRPGTLELKEGSDLTAKEFWTGNGGSGPLAGRVIIDHGAKVTVTTDSLRNGHWSGTPGSLAVHKMEISGELDAPSAILYNTYDAPRGEVHLKEGGLLRVKGIWANRQAGDSNSTYNHQYGEGTGAGSGRHWFTMEGGRLELGGSGFGGARMPGVTIFDFRNGDIVNISSAWGGDVGFPMFFGYDRLGGNVTFDMAEYFVNWNTGLSGASDLTIKGSVNFQGNRCDARIQGVMLGELSVENTGANDLRVTSAFSGGLKLAEGVNAEVAKYSDERYPFAVAGWHYDALPVTQYSYPFVSSDFWTFTARHYGSNPIRRYTSVSGRGEFYVPAEKAGVWSFCGQCDDRVRLDVDGTLVMNASGNCAVAQGKIELAEGWHKFTLTQADYTGGSGPSNAGFANVMAFGFFIGESTSTAPGDYTPFKPGANLGDGLTLQVRPVHNVCVWSWQNGNGSWNTTENWSHIKCLDSVEYMHRHGNDGTDATGYFNNKKVSRFQGWFKVEENQGGQWSFDMHYDDYKMLVIDGVTLINVGSWGDPTNAKVTLAPGWHRWEARVGDNTGGYGPNNDKNNYWTLSYVAPDSPTEKQFIETNLKLAATLGDIAVLEPTGIYKDLELGAGATLTSSGTMAMPIFGTLKGTGSLAGAWEFAGTANCWEVANAVATTAELPAATFAAATPATFAGLKSVKVTFDAIPSRHTYFLTGAINGLTDADIPAAAITVKDADDGDYSANFTLTVKNGRLALSNSKAGGTFIIVR